MTTPYYTSDDLIDSVKRNISFPFDQNTFTDADILKFANEEMYISQVPSVMQYHEEYFVHTEDVTLVANKKKYPIPERAIAGKLRDLFYVDSQSNEFEMTQINRDDRTHFSDNYGSSNTHKYYFEGDSIVLVTGNASNLTGSLRFEYYLRPNSLVVSTRAAICTGFSKTITIVNASLTADDVLTIGSETFTADTDFSIGASSAETAANLNTAINAGSAATSSVSSDTVTIVYSTIDDEVSSESSGFTIQSTIGFVFSSIPTNITVGSKIDIIQTRGSHKAHNLSVTIPTGSISGTTINLSASSVSTDFVVGDYFSSEFECIIPQIPDDLHTALAQRTCSRILDAIGDSEGLKRKNDKINEIEMRQGTLLDNRAEGSPQKVLNTHSHLRYGKRKRFSRRN